MSQTLNVLSIDFDYFQKVSRDILLNDYPAGCDLSTELSVLRYKLKEYKEFSLSVEFKNNIRGDYKEDGTKKDNWEVRYGAFVGFGIKDSEGGITGWKGNGTGTFIKPFGPRCVMMAGSFDDKNSGKHCELVQWDTCFAHLCQLCVPEGMQRNFLGIMVKRFRKCLRNSTG